MRKIIAILSGAFLIVAGFTVVDQASAHKRHQAKAEPFKWSFVKAKDLGFEGENTAEDDSDPENPSNHVVSVDTDPAQDGSTLRVGALTTKVEKGTQVSELDNQIEVKYLLVDRDCAGGAPRFQLGIDADGDGEEDGNAFGYLGDQAFGGTCTQDAWTYEDMTNAAPKWDLSQLGGGQSLNWDAVEAFFTNPEHSVRSAGFADDSASFADTAGCAYYDTITVGEVGLSGAGDTSGDGGGGNGC